MAEPSSELRAVLASLVKLDAVPQLPFLPFARARIRSQGVDGRVSLQMVDRGDSDGPELGDTLPVPVWMGVPGCSADHTPGQELVLGFSRGDGSDPVAFLATPKGQPGHVPIRVRFEATTELRYFSASAGVMRVGAAGTHQVALGPALDAILAALRVFADALTTATDPTVSGAATALKLALNAPAFTLPTKAAKLEAI